MPYRVSYLQVVAAPNVDIPQIQAAQEFKELSDKVANERSLKRHETAAAGRGGRGGRGGRSKSPPRPSSRSGGRGRTPSVPAIRKGGGGGGQQRRQSTGSASSDSSSRHRRISRSRGTKKRPTSREVGGSAGDEEGGAREQAHSDEAGTKSELAPTRGTREGVAATEVDVGKPNQQEEGASPPAGAVAGEAGAPSAGDELVEDTAEAPQHQGGNAEEETVLISDRSQDDDADEASLDTEKVDLQQDTSVAEGASLAHSASAVEVTTLVDQPRVQGDTSLASTKSLSQDEGDIDPGVSASSTTEVPGGQVETRRQQEREKQIQQSDSTPAAAETKTAIPQQLEAAAAESRQHHDNSRGGGGGGADSVPMRTVDNGADGGRGSETEKSRRRSPAAAIEFVPTERSLAAFCKV